MRRCNGVRQLRVFALIAICISLTGVALKGGNRNAYPLPEDRGAAGTLRALEKLPVYVHVLQTTAHPDDESAGTLVWLTRRAHARTAIFCLTRGEGGQNILGDEKYEAMGLLRTGEFLEACKFYGVELYFATAFDFGFSKTAEETLSKWGHQEILGEMVRFIRTWKPTIIISKFEGTARDGHGHHQAAGILTKEAYQEAADPAKFPEQIKELGLAPWQAKKLYYGSFRTSETTGSAPEGDWTVQVPIGDYDPVLGRSYREIGTEGYSKHRSQGNGAAFSLPGPAYDSYRLLNSMVGSKPKEKTFFDSIDISLSAIAELAGDRKSAVSFLPIQMYGVMRIAEEALTAFQANEVGRSAGKVTEGITYLRDAIRKVESSDLPKTSKDAILSALREKVEDFENAANTVLGIYLVSRR